MGNMLHVHSEYSLHDSTQTPEEIVIKAKSLGCNNVTLTDHGTLLGIESFMAAGKKHGVNTIPGIEAYMFKRQHLILVAKDYEGYQSISHAVREANEHQEKVGKHLIFPIMTDEIIKKYFTGNTHVIATTACIAGPIAAILLSNKKLEENVKKSQEKRDKLRDDYISWLNASDSLEKCADQISELKKEKNDLLPYTKPSYSKQITKLEKQIEKIRNEGGLFIEERTEKLVSECNLYKNMKDGAEQRLKDIEALIVELNSQKKSYKKVMDSVKTKKDRYILLEKKLKSVNYAEESQLYELAKDELFALKSIFPNLFIELQYHGLEDEAYVMPILVKLAKDTETPLIAANDAHMNDDTEDSITARKIVRFNFFDKFQTVSDADRTLYMKSEDELKDALSLILDPNIADVAVSNTAVLEQCHVVFPDEKHYPKVKSDVSFDELIEDAKRKKIASGEWSEVYEDRLNHEINVIKSMGFVDYHMVVRDFCIMSRKLGCVPQSEIHNIPLDFSKVDAWLSTKGYRCGVGAGPGRGSAVGSLVCYLLGITNIDPVKYDLLFERFLNPERVSMPDIDSDIKTSIRPIIIRYAKWRHGEKAVCSIMTETTYAAKGAIQMAGRERADELYKGKPNELILKKDYLSKTIKISDIISKEPDACLKDFEAEFKKQFGRDKESNIIWEHAKLIEGKLSATGVHAGGIVISDNDDINDYIPLAWRDEKKVWAAQCNMLQIEERGLLKIDLLGLSMLDCISDCLQMIEKYHGVVVDLDRIPFELEVFQNIFSAGLTNSVFQFESEGMKSLLKRFKPTSFEDLILLVACYRPGPMQYLDDIIEVKQKRKEISYRTPELEPILSKTYGAIVFQEQVMQIFQELAGYSLGQADLVRRAMSKKKVEKLKVERLAFVQGDPERNIEGCVKRGIAEKTANILFDEMMDFARYAFNKSHAAGYALIAYQTAWLKYHYTEEYLCAMFNNKAADKFAPVISDCRTYRIEILPPRINRSFYNFVLENGKIRFGFKGIKGIGDENVIDRMIKLRSSVNTENPYISLQDFLSRTLSINNGTVSIVNRRIMESLINSGSFDEFAKNRESLLEHYDKIVKLLPSKKEEAYELSQRIILEYEIPDADPDMKYNRRHESNLLGCILSEDPLKAYKDEKAYGCVPISEMPNSNVSVFGLVVKTEMKKSAKGNPMIFLEIQGKDESCSAILMNNIYEVYKNHLEQLENSVVKITGRYNGTSIFVSDLGYLSSDEAEYALVLDTIEKTEAATKILGNLPNSGEIKLYIQFNYGKTDTPGQYKRISAKCIEKNIPMGVFGKLQFLNPQKISLF